MERNISKSLAIPRFVVGCLLMLPMIAFTASSAESASDWKPTETVQIVVASAAGSSPDRDARMIQKIFQEKKLVDANIVVQAIPGGGGAVGWTTLNRQAGNGHYFSTNSPVILTSQIIEKGPIVHTDFTQLAILNFAYASFVVRADSPIKTGQDFIDRLKKDPASLSIGFSSARGNQNHIAAAMVVKAAGGDVNKMKAVVFPGAGDVMMNLLGGHIDSAVGPTGVYYQQVAAGKLRIIAVAAAQRTEGIGANFPTWKEQGYNILLADFRGLMGPKGMTPAQVAYWDNVFSNLTKLEEWKKYDKDNFAETYYLNSKETEKFMNDQYALYKGILVDLGMAAK
jgi:putative tricarboxylic transport membrane protein